MSIIPVAVEKLAFSEESGNLGDRKCLGEVEKSFVELPDAKQFLRILDERVFQQPPLLPTLTRRRHHFVDGRIVSGAVRLGQAQTRFREWRFQGVAGPRHQSFLSFQLLCDALQPSDFVVAAQSHDLAFCQPVSTSSYSSRPNCRRAPQPPRTLRRLESDCSQRVEALLDERDD